MWKAPILLLSGKNYREKAAWELILSKVAGSFMKV